MLIEESLFKFDLKCTYEDYVEKYSEEVLQRDLNNHLYTNSVSQMILSGDIVPAINLLILYVDGGDALRRLGARQKMELLTCIRLALDLVHAVNTLPSGVLWSSKLKSWHIGLIGTFSSVLGIYQIFAKKTLT